MTPVEQLLRELGDGHIGMDQRVVRSILKRPEEAGKAIVSYGLNPPEEARLEMDADLVNLLANLPDADSLPYLTKLLSEGLAEIPTSMFQVLKPKGPAAVEALLSVYQALDEEVSGEVAFLLAGLGVKDQRILDLLLARLEFDMEDASISIGTYGDPAAIPAIEKMLAEVGKNHDLDFALEQLKHPAPADAVGGSVEQELMFDIAEEYPEETMPEFDVLNDAEILEVARTSEDLGARLEALDILEDLDLTPESVEPLLDLARNKDEDLMVRAAALRALHRAKAHQHVLNYAAGVLADDGQPMRLRAAALISLMPEFPADEATEFIEQFLADSDSRADGVQAMWRSRNPQYTYEFSKFLSDADPEVKRQAIRGAGVMADKGSLAGLRELLRDEDFRNDAIFAYAMAAPSETSPSRMRSLFKKIEQEAGGLTESEAGSVGMALDMRLEALGKAPIFFPNEEEDENEDD